MREKKMQIKIKPSERLRGYIFNDEDTIFDIVEEEHLFKEIIRHIRFWAVQNGIGKGITITLSKDGGKP